MVSSSGRLKASEGGLHHLGCHRLNMALRTICQDDLGVFIAANVGQLVDNVE